MALSPYTTVLDEHKTQFKKNEVRLVDGVPVTYSDVVVHSFSIGDVEDPDLYAGSPLSDWQSSEEGEWVSANAIEPVTWYRHLDFHSYGWKYSIVARLRAEDQTYWTLKWKNS